MVLRKSRHNEPLEQRRWQCQEVAQVDCNLCGSSHFTVLAKENDLPVVICKKCGLVYVNPRPSDRELEKFYQQYFPPGVSVRWKKATYDLFHTDIKRIEGYRPRGRILDIGCGFGFFLHLMQERGWEVHGCDLSLVATKHAIEQLGLTRIKCGLFQKHHYPTDYFDVICAWYALHHVSNPKQVLEKAHASLKSGGIIALRVPNLNLFKCLWWLKKLDCHGLRMLLRTIRKETADARVPYNVLDPPVHLYAFTPKVLAGFLEDVGFLVIKIYNDGMVERGNVVNRVVDGAITHLAEIIKLISKNKVDLSISFSIYAKKV